MKEIKTNRYIQAQAGNLPPGTEQWMIDKQFGSPDRNITTETGESEITMEGILLTAKYTYDYDHNDGSISNVKVISAQVNQKYLDDIAVAYEAEILRDIKGGL